MSCQIPIIYVDWNDDYGNDQIGLCCEGSREDIQKKSITLSVSLRVKIYGDQLEAEAVIKRHSLYKVWIAEIIPGTLKTVKE